TDNLGVATSKTLPVTVNPSVPPVVQLSVTPSSGIAPVTVSASTAGTTAPNGSIAATSIDFGDGSPAVNAASASHTYNAAGAYTVTATVTDKIGRASCRERADMVNASVPLVVQLSGTPSSGITPV